MPAPNHSVFKLVQLVSNMHINLLQNSRNNIAHATA